MHTASDFFLFLSFIGVFWIGNSFAHDIDDGVFEYQDLEKNKQKIISKFSSQGYIIVSNAPGFKKSYYNFMNNAFIFKNLSEVNKNKYKKSNYYNNGWSYGVEGFNGVVDLHKGSYYAAFPDDHTNLWPDHEFKTTYLKLGKIIFDVGKKILNLINFNLKATEINNAIGRMIYYSPVYKPAFLSNNDYWFGEHKDHGIFTGMTPITFYKDGDKVSEPENIGLFVENYDIRLDDNMIMFYFGEAGELFSYGRFKASKYSVKKAYGGFEGISFSMFFNTNRNTPINSTITNYSDRYIAGMTYGEWCQAAFNKYYRLTPQKGSIN